MFRIRVLSDLVQFRLRDLYSYQCCGSGMFIPDPGTEFFPTRIQDP
jgi:hypothetical protein